MTNGTRLVLAFTFILGQKQAQLQSAMETVKIYYKCVGSTINAGSGFHGSSVLRLFLYYFDCFFSSLFLLLLLLHMLNAPLPIAIVLIISPNIWNMQVTLDMVIILFFACYLPLV